MAVSKAQQKAVNKYVKDKYDRVLLTVPKGDKEIIQAHAEDCHESVNSFIRRAINETMERDVSGGPQEAAGAPEGAGVVSLPFETIKAAQRTAEATGEALPQFVARAVETQAQLDKSSLALGINPAAEGKLEKEA